MSNTQSWDPEAYARNARFVADLGMPVVELLDPQPGERILDLGCGDGALTEKLVAIGCQVVGTDSSPEQIYAAIERGLDAYVIDGQNLSFNAEFEAVFTNAALHWMKRPEAVISGVWQALKPGGRFVGEFGGHGNIASIRVMLHYMLKKRGIDPAPLDPWYFPTTAEYGQLLEAQGFHVISAEIIPRPTPLPSDISGWLETFAQTFTTALPQAERPALIEDLREALSLVLCDAGGNWTADYVRLRFAAAKPG